MKKTNSHLELVKIAMEIAKAYYKTISSKYDLKRYNNMVKYINSEIAKIKAVSNGSIDESNARYDDGILGRVIELYCRDSNSTLTEVRTQGKCDAYIPTASGKRVKAEIKTNGGQVHELIKMSRAQQERTLMIYFNHTEVPTGKNSNKPKSFYDCFKIMTVAEFLDIAVVTKPRSNGAINIQPTSKKMHNNLKAFEDFRRNTVYNF